MPTLVESLGSQTNYNKFVLYLLGFMGIKMNLSRIRLLSSVNQLETQQDSWGESTLPPRVKQVWQLQTPVSD